MLFPTLKKNWCKQKISGGGGCGFFFFRKTILVERDSWNLYLIYPLFPCSDFVSQMWGWLGGGGGVMFFSHFMLFPTFLENKRPPGLIAPLHKFCNLLGNPPINTESLHLRFI